jgi:dolichyl-phosphate-mannose--protein O-mannosyl transferase
MQSLWFVKEGHGQKPCATGSKIAYGTRFRLTHVETGSNLHSHGMRSPLSNQQEVTGFGEGGEGDRSDDWMVQPKRNSKDVYWRIGDDVFLKHAETNMYLGSTEQAKFTMNNCGRNCPVMNHLEVFGRKNADTFGYWKTETGIYLFK